jgi:hypothetical protein
MRGYYNPVSLTFKYILTMLVCHDLATTNPGTFIGITFYIAIIPHAKYNCILIPVSKMMISGI